MAEDLTSIDRNFFLLDTETSSQTIACLAVTQGCPNAEAFIERIALAVEQFPRARLRPIEGLDIMLAGWEEDPAFTPGSQLCFHELPGARTREELLIHASILFSRRFADGRPLWCFHVVWSPAVGESIVLFLIHHGFGDGGGGMEFFHAVCEPRKRGETIRESVPRLQPVRSRPPRESRTWFAETSRFASVRRAFADMQVRRAPFPFHGKNSAVRDIRLLTLPLERAKLIRDVLDVSLNDVYLAYVAGAAKRLAVAHRFSPAVRVFIPFNLRPRTARRDLGNYLSAVPLSLPVAETDPAQRVLLIHDETSRLKDEGSFGAFGLLGTFASYLPKRFRRRLLLSACRRGNFICTNVPSSRQQLVIGGAPVIESYGCAALLPEQGISVGFMSYVDRVCVSLVSDPALTPNPREILTAIAEAEDELLENAVGLLPADSRVQLRESLGR